MPLVPPLMQIVEALWPPLMSLLNAIMPILSPLLGLLQPIASVLGTIASVIGKIVKSFGAGVINSIAGLFGGGGRRGFRLRNRRLHQRPVHRGRGSALPDRGRHQLQPCI